MPWPAGQGTLHRGNLSPVPPYVEVIIAPGSSFSNLSHERAPSKHVGRDVLQK